MNFDFLSNPNYDILGAFWMNVQLTVYSSIGVAEAALLMSTMVENESNALISVFVVFALGFLVLTLPLGLLLGVVAKRMAVRR